MAGDHELSDTYKAYEAACERIREQNAVLFESFREWLGRHDMSGSKIRLHVRNADLYINNYLLYEDVVEAANGISSVGMFLGYWYIRKVSSGESSIRSQAASVKKFYQFMLEQGLVLEDSVNCLNQEIESGMPGWLGRMSRYNDESITDPDVVWGYKKAK